MKISFRSALCMALAALVSACGGQNPAEAPIKTAAAMQVVIAPAATGADTVKTAAAMQAVIAPVAPGAGTQSANAQGPTPDCAPENCQGLRIIDGNAEAYRIDALRRAAAEAGGPQV